MQGDNSVGLAIAVALQHFIQTVFNNEKQTVIHFAAAVSLLHTEI